jgi:HlyD family secretion protein
MRVKTALSIGTILGGCAVGLGVWVGLQRSLEILDPVPKAAAAAPEPANDPSPAPPSTAVVAAAQGRVEGLSESVEVEASADGRIQTLLVREGEKLVRDQIVATLSCDNLDSEIRSLEAVIEATKQARIRILRGSREEERQLAEESVRSAKILVDQAQRESDRMRFLASKDGAPEQIAEAAKRDFDTAESAWKTAQQTQKLVNAGPLPEEVAKADAEVVAAEEKLAATVAQREKCNVRSPISGTVTHVNLNVGESFSTFVPRPIITMADLSGRRIRAEVDERDLSRIHINQRVRVSAEGLSQAFQGTVSWTSVVMGRKTAKSADPSERADRDILETLIVPDRGTPPPPIGLRVVIEFLRD